MFNRNLKEEYIDFEKKESNKIALENYFKRLYDAEVSTGDNGTDIIFMTYDELKIAFLSLGIRRDLSISHFLASMRGYASWALLVKGITKDKKAFDIMTVDALKEKSTITSKMLGDYEQLKTIIFNGLDTVNYPNASMRNSLVLHLVFDGLTFNDIVDLKKSDLDLNTNSITLGGGYIVKLSDETVDLWLRFQDVDGIEKKNAQAERSTKSTTEEYIMIPLIDNDYLIRPQLRQNARTQQTQIPLSSLNRIIRVIYKTSKSSEQLSPSTVRISGVFHRLYQCELKGEINGVKITSDIDNYEYEIAKYLAYHLRVEYNDKGELMLKLLRWRKDYSDWKYAFGYTS